MNEIQPASTEKESTMQTTKKPQSPAARRLLHASGIATAFCAALTCIPSSTVALGCVADCDGDGTVAIHELIRGVGIALESAPVEDCSSLDANADGAVTINELVTGVINALEGCPRGTLAFLIATDFDTGAYATISLDDRSVVEPASPATQVHGDAVPRFSGQQLFVVNRSGEDSTAVGPNIQRLDPDADFATRWRCTTGSRSNPQDIAVLDDTKAYVTRLAEAELLIINPSSAPDCSDFLLGTIDLSEFADADGIPEMYQMAIVDGFLYVALQRLNNFFPAAPGAIVEIDTATDTAVRLITLSAENPFGATKGLTVRDGDLFVPQVGRFGVKDGGIERIALPAGTSRGFIVTEEALGGDINDFVLVSDELGYATIGLLDFTNSVVAFDPSTGVVTRVLLEGVEFISDLELNDRGELFVLDRTLARPGVRIFRAEDGMELTAEPIYPGLSPFEVVFLP